MKCEYCGAIIPLNATSCEYCGGAVISAKLIDPEFLQNNSQAPTSTNGESEKPILKCKCCEKEIHPGMTTCHSCGASINFERQMQECTDPLDIEDEYFKNKRAYIIGFVVGVIIFIIICAMS